ncbi:MAG: hypothetical protein ACPGFC_12525, partial [Paracoccaceae bacterium]
MMLRVLYVVGLAVGLLGGMVPMAQAETAANPKMVLLYPAPSLMDSGLLRHILPRFSLKTQVRVTVVDDPAQAGIILDARGQNAARTALFDGLDDTWAMAVVTPDHPGTQRFADWL